MQVHLCAVGRLRRGPERSLVDDYTARFNRAGRTLGLGPLNEHEIEDRRGGGIEAEAALLRRSCPDRALRVALDERGNQISSPALAERLAEWRDRGEAATAFFIGGADGLAPGLREEAAMSLSLGPMVWPHMLVRVMLAEQLYRAATILSGTPYHRH